MMATCDARYYYNQGGLPSVIFGGMNNGQAHAKGEYAELPDVLETAAEYAGFFIDWCGTASRGGPRSRPRPPRQHPA
jgi:acetylornithine deacetylase/succinyl-diaminopimelate desuccinylase-like protein